MTTHELLEQIRERPAMYLGNHGRQSLRFLSAFMDGARFSNCLDPDPPYGGFICWLGCQGVPTTHPINWLIEEHGDGVAFARFFELWDVYRQCHREDLFRAVLKDHKANFQTLGADGEFGEPRRPLELIIAQFAPSSAYAVVEVYSDFFSGMWSFTSSLAEAKRQARRQWNVRANEWCPLNEQYKCRIAALSKV